MNRLKAQNKTHLQWVDNTKLLACTLVVLGHFAQSMVRAGILPDTVAYTLCNSALYTFHVPLFFICSAYLYRRFTVLRTCRDYARHVGKKALALGVPYFTFAGANYALKLLFPAGVNMAEERGPVAYFFLNPPAPFWYLPVLFLFFVLIPPAGKKGSLALIALGLCTYFICGLSAAAVLPGCVRSLLQNLIWFAMGLALPIYCAKSHCRCYWARDFCYWQGSPLPCSGATGRFCCCAGCWPAGRCYPPCSCGTQAKNCAGR